MGWAKRLGFSCSLEFDAEFSKTFQEGGTALEVDGMHAGFPGARNKTFHIIDKNGFVGTKADLLQNSPVDLGIRLARAHLMRWKHSFEMSKDFELSSDMRKMKRVGVGNKI